MQSQIFVRCYILLDYLLFKQNEASVSSCCLLPLLLTNRLKATSEVIFLLVETFGPPFHVFSNLRGTNRCEHLKV